MMPTHPAISIIRSLLPVVLSAVAAGAKVSNVPPDTVFAQPLRNAHVAKAYQQIGLLYRQKQYTKAMEACRRLLADIPTAADARFVLACTLAVQGQTNEAMRELERAVRDGFRDSAQLQGNPDLEDLRAQSGYSAILRQAGKALPTLAASYPEPALPHDGIARITAANTRWFAAGNVFVTAFDPPAEKPGPEADVVGDLGSYQAASEKVRKWYRNGRAAGNYGDFYLNNDAGHSRLPPAFFPQITRIEYSAEAAGPDATFSRGPQVWYLFNQPVIGNCSMAQTTGPFWRSMAREAMTDLRAISVQARQYFANQLYFYPEHRDYDDAPGDMYPANVPYVVISRGSSGSEQPFLQACALTLAAFPPATKRRLVEHKMLSPTLQQVLRRSYACPPGIEADADTTAHDRGAAANPVVFDSAKLDVERMVDLAQAMRADAVPPLAGLSVLAVPPPPANTPPTTSQLSEQLFATPAAVAFIFRRLHRHFVVDLSAEESHDIDGRPLTYHWVVLQGDATAIRIQPLNDTSSRVRLTIPWFEPFPVKPGSTMKTWRVDIALFVNNGIYDSAPAIFSLSRPPHEVRHYTEEGRLARITYNDQASSDPKLYYSAAWTDRFAYDADGKLLGWTREANGTTRRFAADGRIVLENGQHPGPANRQIRIHDDQTRSIEPFPMAIPK